MVIINYSQIRRNIESINNDVGLVLKNNAYGFGIANIVKYCDDLVSFYAVININEAIYLRGLTNKRILLLEFSKQFDLIKKYNLLPTASSSKEIDMLNKEGISFSLSYDVGMNRFGFRSITSEQLLNDNLVEIYAHVPYYSKNIRNKLNEMVMVSKENNLYCHVGGSIMLNKCSLPLRLGLIAYARALGLYAKVLAVRVINRLESIGYDGAYLATKAHLYAILDVGYSDGISALYNGYVVIHKKKYKVIGRVCMNNMFIMADSSINVGDTVEIFGNTIDIKTFARFNKASVYECMLRINK